jgi:hypothetical protein
LRFDGPMTVLVQSRASRLNEVLSAQEINEIADTPPGVTEAALDRLVNQRREDTTSPSGIGARETREVRQTIASIRRDGQVEFQRSGDA